MVTSVSGSPLQAAQPIVNPDGTMAYHFRDWIFNANQAIGDSSLLSTWGSISGTLSAQTDLQTALDGKSATGHTHVEADITDLDHTDTDAIHSSVSAEISALTEKSTLVDADLVIIEDSEASNAKKKVQRSNLIRYAPPTVRDESGSPYTLVLGDANEVLRFTTASAAVTIPVEASVAFPTGTEVSIRQAGTGTLTLTTTSLTINGTVPSWAQHVEVKFRKVGTDTWDVV